MKLVTKLTDWAIVEVVDADIGVHLKPLFLWGIVQEDQLGRYETGNYVCTSLIKSIAPKLMQVVTNSNNTYELLGSGQRIKVSVKEFKKLVEGYSPDEISILRSITSLN
jgi:hypothetical protein|tara:strand:- start:11223 stop:11549 length:327 start_codon:yes stop_codon:yes gene_type:complete